MTEKTGLLSGGAAAVESTGVAGSEPGAEKDMPTQLVPVKANLCSMVMIMTFTGAVGGHLRDKVPHI